MYLRKLTLTNMRAFRTAEFDFFGQEGMHLIVGVNGVGKSTALEALRVSLAQAVRKIEKSVIYYPDFPPTDITINQEEMEVEVAFEAGNVNFVYTRKRFSAAFLATPGKTADDPDFLWQTKPVAELKPDFNVVKRIYDDSILPLVIFFSPLRSVIKRVTLKQLANTDKPRRLLQNPAYDNALVSRPSKLIEFYYWVRNLEELSKESKRHLLWWEKLEESVQRFLPNCANLRTASHITGRSPALLIDKDNKAFDLLQLSDGERGVLALVIEISLRLAQANPELLNPNDEASAIILIDELDLHLHPGWQREIVGKLQSTFPKCQFIASTHSPQVIGEVPHERVSIIQAQAPQVVHPSQTFGMDSNWIIDVLMDAEPRNVRVALAIKKLFSLIAPATLAEAKALLLDLRNEIGLGSSELSRAEASINRLERTSRETN